MKLIDFNELEIARITVGFFLPVALAELGVSERTWYRWKNSGKAPYWALRLMELQTGDLSHFGWKHWNIEEGILYCDQVNRRYYNWTPGKILSQIFFKESRRIHAAGSASEVIRLPEPKSQPG